MPLKILSGGERGLEKFCFLSFLIPREVSEKMEADWAPVNAEVTNYSELEYDEKRLCADTAKCVFTE